MAQEQNLPPQKKVAVFRIDRLLLILFGFLVIILAVALFAAIRSDSTKKVAVSQPVVRGDVNPPASLSKESKDPLEPPKRILAGDSEDTQSPKIRRESNRCPHVVLKDCVTWHRQVREKVTLPTVIGGPPWACVPVETNEKSPLVFTAGKEGLQGVQFNRIELDNLTWVVTSAGGLATSACASINALQYYYSVGIGVSLCPVVSSGKVRCWYFRPEDIEGLMESRHKPIRIKIYN